MISGIIKSFESYGTASSYLFKPWALKYVIISAIISLITLSAFIGLIYYYGDNLGAWIGQAIPFKIEIEWIVNALEWFFRIALLLALVFIFKYVILIVTAPVMSLLSESIEIRLTQNTIPQLSFTGQIKSMLRGTALAVSNLTREILITIPIFIASFIPGVAFLTAPLLIMVQSYYAGFGNYDFFMERRYSIRRSRNFMNRNKGYAIGNGFLFLSLLFVPLIGVLIAPSLSTIAATISGLDLIED